MTGRSGTWIVPADAAKVRLDHFLLEAQAGETRSQIQNWIRQGRLLVNGQRVKAGHRIRPGEAVTLEVPAPVPVGPRAEAIPLHTVYQDADMAVIDKPAGIVCHEGAGVRSGTLVNALLFHFGALEGGDPSRPGIVHRLDKLTSGLLVVARTAAAHRHLSSQFKNRRVRKIYWAAVHGRPSPAAGTIDLPLARDPSNRKKMSTRGRRGRAAITHFRVLEQAGPIAALEVRIETGRTHQIRVHLAHAGHPVVGDSVYGRGRDRTLEPELAECLPQRYCLHARRLELRHPRTGDPLSFEAQLPQELGTFMERARSLAALPKRSDRSFPGRPAARGEL